MTKPVRPAAAFTSLLVLVLGACSEKAPGQKPTPPDMSALLGAYERPTLTLSASNMGAVATARSDLQELVDRALQAFPELQEALDTGLHADQYQDQFGLKSKSGGETLELEGEGFLKVRRICPGWTDPPQPIDANGVLELILGFTERGIDPVVWGSASNCRFHLATEQLELHGAVHLWVGQNLQFDQLGTSPVLVEMAGEIGVGGVRETLRMDFVIQPAILLEYRVRVGEEHLIYWESGAERGFRAANGRFSCDFGGLKCTAEDGSLLTW